MLDCHYLGLRVTIAEKPPRPISGSFLNLRIVPRWQLRGFRRVRVRPELIGFGIGIIDCNGFRGRNRS